MEKVYNHKTYERQIYELWEKSHVFTPKIDKHKTSFIIIMPPPNANDPLHIGHARFVAIEDTLTRYHRMRGEPTLWLPGADHAGIETQFVFEKRLKEKGHSRFDYDRETLFKMIWDYSQKNKATMMNQLRQLGASADWTRFKFTLDPEIVEIVYKTFKKLYDQGLIYRGKRIVNYCPRCGTNFSELEVDSVEREDNLYYLDYGALTIATTRPETIFADVAIAVHPKDSRFQKLIGQTATIPIVNREVPIIPDSLVDMKFGTGALKITPGHDSLDFEIGQKHKLPIISVIDEGGRMTATPEIYIGLKAEEAREKVARDLESLGKIKKVEKIKHVVGVCYRDKGVIEPTISEQWFLKVEPLTKQALIAIKNKEVKFPAEQYKKIATHWLKNLRDWNISRQIVWGIRIPAFKCDKCLKWTVTNGPSPAKCTTCGHEKLKQDNDTFDTWFRDFEYFYPTSVMNTAYEILPFWVIRMIMLGIYATDEVPFKTVLIHGLVRDREGQKISKSKGNVIDPIDMSEKYGADSLRMGIVWGSLVHRDISLNEDNVRAQRNFANKIWNAARFVLLHESGKRQGVKGKKPRPKHEDDRKILAELKTTIKKVTKALDKYRLNEAAEILYDFFWNKFANEYLESTKDRRAAAQPILEFVLQQSLKLLHPFMPFVTETVWSFGMTQDKQRFDAPLLITASWPK
ncbi:valine--tRNA ligase [Candidatus Woesebacteria bacterium]|nr:valine--tRNA ligase [Candidatus Woesebacteria bacterium]